jgi:hypothetical protein
MRNVGNDKIGPLLEVPGAAVAVFAAAIVAVGLSFTGGCNKHEKPVLSPDFNAMQDTGRINTATILADGPGAAP